MHEASFSKIFTHFSRKKIMAVDILSLDVFIVDTPQISNSASTLKILYQSGSTTALVKLG